MELLTREQLQDLSGFKQKRRIREWLADAGYKFEVARNGWPKVLARQLEERQGLGPGKKAEPEPQLPLLHLVRRTG